jgi:uncharacterized alkaline shock family protein YloU
MSDENPTAAFPEAPAASGGETWIADAIVAKVAATAAREVDGVEDLRGGGVRRGWVRASERRRGGASVRIDAGTATIALRLVVRDGVAIPGVVESVRARVVERVEFATGMTVARVDIGVVDVVPPPAEDDPAESPAAAGTAHAGPDPSAAVPAGA